MKYKDLLKQDFMECPTCIVKPGMPILCNSCLLNRNLIEDLKKKLTEYRKKLKEKR